MSYTYRSDVKVFCGCIVIILKLVFFSVELALIESHTRVHTRSNQHNAKYFPAGVTFQIVCR